MRDHFAQKLHRELPGLQRDYHVRGLQLFGSVLRDDFSPESDIDILVEFTETPSLFEFVRLENHLTELLGRNVDLVLRSSVKEMIRERIYSEAVAV